MIRPVSVRHLPLATAETVSSMGVSPATAAMGHSTKMMLCLPLRIIAQEENSMGSPALISLGLMAAILAAELADL